MSAKKKKKVKKKASKKDENPEMTRLKEEIARELGLEEEISEKGWANLSSRETGKVGGVMSSKMKRKNNPPSG